LSRRAAFTITLLTMLLAAVVGGALFLTIQHHSRSHEVGYFEAFGTIVLDSYHGVSTASVGAWNSLYPNGFFASVTPGP
jgi:hypothetical protein